MTAQSQAELERLTALYNKMLAEAERTSWPVIYKNDLLVHDKEFLSKYRPHEFIWILRECGTNAIPLAPLHKDLTWELEYFRNNDTVRFYHANQDSLTEITYEQGKALIEAAITRDRQLLAENRAYERML